MKSLVLAEKPSVAREIARVLGCSSKHKQYMEGPDYIVTWALVTWLALLSQRITIRSTSSGS